MDIPHPTWREIFISAQIFICLYPEHVFGRLLEQSIKKEAKKLRRHYIAKHVQQGHRKSWHNCIDASCNLLK